MFAIDAPLDVPLGSGRPGDPRLVVDVWPAVPTPEGWRVMILKRSVVRGGFWQGVSGRVESKDASIEAAARREIREETGLVEGIDLFDLGRWVDFIGPQSGLSFRKRSLGATLPPGTGPTTVVLSREHVEARLVTFDEARRLVSFPVNVEELSLVEARVHAPPA